jgi:AraC-like DNA-binding protein
MIKNTIENFHDITFLSVIRHGSDPLKEKSWNILWKDQHHICYLMEGCAYYTFSHGTYKFDKDDLFFVKQGEPYKITSLVPTRWLKLHFKTGSEIEEPSGLLLRKAGPTIRHLALETEQNYFRKKKGWQMYCKGLLYQILGLAAAMGDTKKMKQYQIEIVGRASDYIHNNYADPDIQIAEIAKNEGISSQYLKQLFRRYYDTTPVKYLRKFRIERAKDLLNVHYLQISDIAEKTGFNDEYYFSKTFKSLTGENPSDYRSRLFRR